MAIIDRFFDSLKRRYEQQGKGELWNCFLQETRGALAENIQVLQKTYPHEIPKTLIEMLKRTDGSYQIGEIKKESFVFFSSDIPISYYLLRSEDMTYNFDASKEFGCKASIWENLTVDSKILLRPEFFDLLPFAACTNRGFTSSLYINYSPSEIGNYGQIVRFLYDPSEFKVIAKDFDEFLQMNMEQELYF